MRRQIGSPSLTYSEMPITSNKQTEERKKENNFVRSQNAHNQANLLLINTQLPNIHQTHDPNSWNLPGPYRKLEPPDAPYPNQLNGYDKTGQSRANLRIMTRRTQMNQKNYQVHPSYDLTDAEPSTSESVKPIINGSKARSLKEMPGNEANHVCVNVTDSESDSDFSSDSAFFNTRKGTNRDRMPYSRVEDLEILKFVLEGDNIYRTSSISLWKELELEKTNPKRTFHSLKNRFMRNIKPIILTRYGKLISGEKVKMLIKKFPELQRMKKNAETHSCIPIQGIQKKEPLHPCLDKERVRLKTRSETLAANNAEKKFCLVRAFKDVSVGTENETLELGLHPNIKNEKNAVVGESSVPRIEFKKKGKLKDVTSQTFEYSAALGSFKKEAAINLNLILLRNIVNSEKISSGSLLYETDKPVNVKVRVLLSTGNVNKRLKGRGKRKKGKNQLENIYFLKLRKGKGKAWEKKAVACKKAAEILISTMEKRKKERDEGIKEGNGDEVDICPMVLRSETRAIEAQEEENRDVIDISSSDEDSYFSQAVRNVKSVHQVVILPLSERDENKNGKE